MKRLVSILLLGACSSAPAPPLRQSCDTQATWSSSQDCETCIAQTTRPRCECDTAPAAGACLDQGRAYSASADCQKPVTDCVAACNKDCACIDGCYQAHETCRSLAAELEACIVKACEQRCR